MRSASSPTPLATSTPAYSAPKPCARFTSIGKPAANNPADLPRYRGVGIGYVVLLQAKNHLPQTAAFENAKYAVYAVR
jgi:hypothetical protein